MSAAVCLLLYAVAVVVLGPPLLRSLTSSGRAPRLGVAAWLTAIGGVLLAGVAVIVLLVIDVARFWNQPAELVASCATQLRAVVAGDAGIAPQILLIALLTTGCGSAAMISVRVARAVVRMRIRAREHADAVRIVGRHDGARDVVVVEAEKPAAYCVTGRPSAVVVTSAAVGALDEPQLAAVLAHEHAHLAGRHWMVIAALRGLAAVLPGLALMTEGAEHVSRLLEMCADDAAARRHDRRALLSGLIALCHMAPAEALAAADIAVLARAERLAAPPAHADRNRTRAALMGVIVILAVGPLFIITLAGSGVMMCCEAW